jgi:serine/threonine protein phosphatase PrpC
MVAKRVMSIVLLFVVMFSLNLMYLIIYFPPPQETGMLNRHNENRSLRKKLLLQTNTVPMQVTLYPKIADQQTKMKSKVCPRYGCHQYPPELTPQLNQSLVHAFRSDLPVPAFDQFASDTFAMLTQQGKSHTENQDRGLFISPFVIHVANQESELPPSFLAAIFDGHNGLGHLVAQEVAERLPGLLAEKLQQSMWGRSWDDDRTDVIVAAAFNETFVQVNRDGDSFYFLRGGTTASVTLRYGSKLYIANVGDSQTVLVSVTSSSKTGKVEFMTRKDKPFEMDEYDRIHQLGGKIHINPLHPKDSRVVVHSKIAKDTLALAMSRSLGDWEWKEIGVTAEPIVSVIDLLQPRYKDASLFLIAASDGMWDVRKQEFFANQFATAFEGRLLDDRTEKKTVTMEFTGIPAPSNPQLLPLFKLHDVIQRITPKVQKGYRDDITAIITKIQ